MHGYRGVFGHVLGGAVVVLGRWALVLGAPMGAVLLHPTIFYPGVGTMTTPQGIVAASSGTPVVQTKIFAGSTSFLGQFLPTFHNVSPLIADTKSLSEVYMDCHDKH